MAENNDFVSCFKIRGRPILPPVLTPRRRSEMHEYKIKALEIEKRLNERKLLKEKGSMDGPASDNLEEDDDKENHLSPTIKAKLSALENLMVISPIENLGKRFAHSSLILHSDSAHPDDAISATEIENDHQESSISANLLGLVRRGSYTLDTPSPFLSANIERFQVSPCIVPDESKTTVNINKGNDLDVTHSNNEVLSVVCNADSAELVTDVVCTKNCMLTFENTLKNMTGLEEISCELQTKTVISKEKPVDDTIPAGKKLPPKSVKAGSVFERLAADGAKKAEERRKWGKETVFKKPVLKKAPKASKTSLQSSLSSSNIRMSFSEAHRQRSTSLTDMRYKSDTNIDSIASGKTWQSKKTASQNSSNLFKTTRKTNQQRVLNVFSCSLKKDKLEADKGVSASIVNDESLDLKNGSHSLPKKEEKELSSFNSQHDSPPPTKKTVYTVQTSPISPPLPMPSRDNTVEVDAAASQRRKRRRWSESTGIWTSFDESKSSNSSNDVIPSKEVSTSIKETEQLDKLQNKTGLDKDCCLHNLENNTVQEIPTDTLSSEKVFQEPEVSKVEILAVEEKFDGLSLDEVKVKNIGLGKDLGASKIQDSGDHEKNTEKNLSSVLKEISYDICTEKILTVNDPNDVKIGEEVSVHLLDVKEDLKPQNENSTEVGLSLGSKNKEYLNKTEENKLLFLSDCENGRVQESMKEITTDLAYDLVSDVVQNGLANLSLQTLAVEEQKSQNDVDISQYLSPNVQVSLELQSTINSLPDSPKEVRGVKDTAVCLLKQVLDVQKIAFEKLLEEVQKKFMDQQKLIVERFFNLVDELPTSKSHETLASINVKAAVENRKLEEISESGGCMLLQSGDSSKTSFSLCHACHSPSNTCKCSSGEVSSLSSTLIEEGSTVVNLDEHSFSTCKTNEDERKGITCIGSECQALQSSLESNNLSPMTSRIQDSSLNDLFKGMESTLIEGSSVPNGDLDLSGIIDMETREKNLSLAPTACINVLQGNSSCIMSSLDQKKNLENNKNLLDELAAHRKNHEEDMRRLSFVESHARCVLGVAADLNSNFGLPLDNKESKFTNVEDCPVTLRKLITTESNNDNNEREIYLQSELPDLRSDLMALPTFLGAETHSTGPLNLETPISGTSGFQSSECDALQIDSASEMCTDEILDDLNSVSSRVSKSIDNYDEFRLAIENSDNEMLIGENCEKNQIDDKSPSVLDEQKYNTDDSPASELYMTASSSQKQESVCLENNPGIFQAFNKLSAFVKGYLTRRLLKTVRVHNIKAIIEDSLFTALKLHSELISVAEVNPVDIQLFGLILSQLNAACDEFYHIFFGLSIAQQMEIIRADREQLLNKVVTPLLSQVSVAPSPRPALLSAVTLKTLQRRFENKIAVKKGLAGNIFRSKSSGKLECSKKINPEVKKIAAEIGASKEVFARPARARTRSFVLSSGSEEGNGLRETHKRQKKVGNEVKTANMQHKPTVKKRKSRSSSDGKRRPWR